MKQENLLLASLLVYILCSVPLCNTVDFLNK